MNRTARTNRKKASTSRLSPEAWRLIREEARSLGITQDEWVRLAGNLFGPLRQALAKNQSFDGRGLLQLVENPLFGVVIQYLASNINKTSNDGTNGTADGPSVPPATATPAHQGGLHPSLHAPGPQQPMQPQPIQPTLPPPEWQYW